MDMIFDIRDRVIGIITQYMGSAKAYVKAHMNAYVTAYVSAYLRAVYIDHPNAYMHILLTIILAFLLLSFVQPINLSRKLNGIDKRDFISLLTIQKYCNALNRAINELTDTVKENDRTTKNKLRLVHVRMKDVYIGIFKHLDIKRIQRAPHTPSQTVTSESTTEQTEQAQKDNEERNEILREVIQEMLATEQ